MMRVYQLDVDAVRQEESFDLVVAMCFRPNPKLASLAADLFRRGKYEAVANIDTASLDDAYRATQNLDQAWSRNPTGGVEPIEPSKFFEMGQVWGRRSSMIGDVIETIKDERVIARHVVDWIGFAEMPVDVTKLVTWTDRDGKPKSAILHGKTANDPEKFRQWCEWNGYPTPDATP